MKHCVLISGLCLLLVLLGGCSHGEREELETTTPPPTVTVQPETAVKTLRIVDGADTLDLLLAGGDGAGDVYRLDLNTVELPRTGLVLEDGVVVEVRYTGPVLETFPARFAQVVDVTATEEAKSDLCGLYLQVLEDLWAVDNGLNENITELGVDLSGLDGLTEAEKAAVAYLFGQRHGLSAVTGTWEKLRDEGYFTQVLAGPEGEALYEWETGCLFSVEGDTSEFSAQKWRTPLGAYIFGDCTATEAEGVWSYTVGSHMAA